MVNMQLSELIRLLEALKTEHGDLQVRVQSLSHTWAPEPVVKRSGDEKWVLLNP